MSNDVYYISSLKLEYISKPYNCKCDCSGMDHIDVYFSSKDGSVILRNIKVLTYTTLLCFDDITKALDADDIKEMEICDLENSFISYATIPRRIANKLIINMLPELVDDMDIIDSTCRQWLGTGYDIDGDRWCNIYFRRKDDDKQYRQLIKNYDDDPRYVYNPEYKVEFIFQHGAERLYNVQSRGDEWIFEDTEKVYCVYNTVVVNAKNINQAIRKFKLPHQKVIYHKIEKIER